MFYLELFQIIASQSIHDFYNSSLLLLPTRFSLHDIVKTDLSVVSFNAVANK